MKMLQMSHKVEVGDRGGVRSEKQREGEPDSPPSEAVVDTVQVSSYEAYC